MKERLLKIGVPLFLIAVMVVAGVYPVTSQAAAGTTYKVVLQKGSASFSIVSINDGASVPQVGSMVNTSFTIVVESKLKTEKVKSTGATASYYPVTLLAKSLKSPTVEYPMVGGGGTAVKSMAIAGDGKGKLYVSGGDVDYSVVQGEKNATVKIGDGKADVKGSLWLPIITKSMLTVKETGKKMQDVSQLINLTTGTCSLTAQGVKGGTNGKGIPKDDTTKTLPTPFAGKPIDLDKGTGTVIGVSGAMNGKNAMVGLVDVLSAQYWVLTISK